MIKVNIKGNLGNQMFEYALARSIQEKTGQAIELNTCLLSKYKPEYTLHINDFVLNDNVIIESHNSLPWFINTYRGLIRVLKKIFPRLFFSFMSKFGIYIWLKETYVPIKLGEQKSFYLEGFWQSARYFSDIDDIIRKEFTPKEPLRSSNENLYKIITQTESICVTIRRGDYVTNKKYRKKFFLCDESFFLEGVRRIRKEIPAATVIVFSDDVEWAKKNIDFGENVYYESGRDPVWEKMRLMSACKHFVISNSSFSWWAQHLSNNHNKIVYAPSKWFPDNRKCDIAEPNWRYIEV